MYGAIPVNIESISIPTYCIEHKFPVVAVVGAIRPRLFIARKVIDSLSSEELTAALAHESGHLVARDNLKRGLLRACRDVLTIIPCGRLLDSKWSEASEAAADEHAAQAGKTIALDLAATLVKIARMVPPGVTPISASGSLLIGDNVSAIAWRVRRLTELASVGPLERRRRNSFLQVGLVSIGLLSAVIVLIPHYREVLYSVHNVTESFVSLLQ
jgi:Zn-dependent protease with chaperone function